MRAVLVILGLLDQRRRQPLDDLLGDPVVLTVGLAHHDVGQLQRVAGDDVRDLHRGRGVVRTGCQPHEPRAATGELFITRGRPISRNRREGSKRRTMARLDGVSGSVLLTVGDHSRATDVFGDTEVYQLVAHGTTCGLHSSFSALSSFSSTIIAVNEQL